MNPWSLLVAGGWRLGGSGLVAAALLLQLLLGGPLALQLQAAELLRLDPGICTSHGDGGESDQPSHRHDHQHCVACQGGLGTVDLPPAIRLPTGTIGTAAAPVATRRSTGTGRLAAYAARAPPAG